MAAKEYTYKLYKDNVYAGSLDPTIVVSDFGYSQEINSAGTDISIELGATLDDVGATAVQDIVTDQSGNNIVDEINANIIASEVYTFANIPINLANRLDVWLYYSGAVNGVRVFSGLITSWKANYREGKIVLRADSYGTQLDNFMLGGTPDTIVASNTTTNQTNTLQGFHATSGIISLAQTFQFSVPTTVGAFIVNGYSAVIEPTSGYDVLYLRVFSGTPLSSGAQIALVGVTYTYTTAGDILFTLANPIVFDTAQYYFSIEKLPAGYTAYPSTISTNSVSTYANGAMYVQDKTTGWSLTTQEMYFKIVSSSAGFIVPYLSYDPGAIVRSIMTAFTSAGGMISATTTTVDLSSTVVSYTFRFSTVYEAIQKCLQLAPSDWYWYVDPGTNLLHFHRKAVTATHKMVLGVHIDDLQLEYTLDGMKNSVYLSGGDTGSGTNLLRFANNSASVSSYGVWLDRITDNRVTVSTTADILAMGEVSELSSPSFRTRLIVPATVYDIETFKLGDAVEFGNFANFVDSILMHIVNIDRTPDEATIMLDSTLPATAHRIEDIKRNLDNVITIDNPSVTN